MSQNNLEELQVELENVTDLHENPLQEVFDDNKIKSKHRFCLFSHSSENLTPKQKTAYFSFNVFLMLLSTIALGIASLYLACGEAVPDAVFFKYFEHQGVLWLNLIPPMLLFVFLYALTGRAWIAYILDSVIVIGLSVVNYFMLMFRNDPLMFSDILYVREAISISKEGYNYRFTPKIAIALLVCVAFTVILFVFSKYKWNSAAGRVYAVAMMFTFIMPIKEIYFDKDIYDKKTQNIDEEHMNMWSPTNQYLSKGFVYPFMYSMKDSFEFSPNGYNKENAKAILDCYEEKSIPQEKKVHIIGIMLEAYCDLESTLGIEGINPEAYADYRKLRDENYSGKLVTNIFAAGTIDTERAFLTGFTDLEHCRRNTNSYVRYLSKNGYVATGGHPSEDWFYNRKNVNGYLGFSEYLFSQNYFEEKYGELYMRNDANVFNDFFEQYKTKAENGEEYFFGFNVTYQGHGPYTTSIRERGTDENPLYENPDISEESNIIINNYLASLKDTGVYLNAFVQKVMAEDEPVIVVFFGDHKPWLGDSNSAYTELGVDFDLSTRDGFLDYYSTEYVFVANDAAKQLLGNDFKGEGPITSPCFLMNVLFDEMGIDGPQYMQYTNDVRKKIVAVNEAGIIDASGNFYTLENMPEELKEVYDEYQCVTFFERTNFRG